MPASFSGHWRLDGEHMNLAVFVNSSDGFQDCWQPFFELFRSYGGFLRTLPIYLNTERSQFDSGGINLESTKVWPVDETERPSWSDCLVRGMDSIKESHILYLQEDYFLKSPVRDEVVQEAFDIFQAVPTAGVVYLSPNGPGVGKRRYYSKNFQEVCPPAHYLINTQAAIWDKKFLRSLARRWENAWMFEKFASLRARHTTRLIFTVTPEVLNGGEIADYVWSGVMKGKWKRECVELFREHGIIADFDRRGFYYEGSLLKYRLEVLHKLFGRPIPALRSILSLLERNGV